MSDSALEAAVGRIVCRRCLCRFCWDLRNEGLKYAGKGPREFLRAILDHQGMICGCAESMREEAFNALNPPTPPTP